MDIRMKNRIVVGAVTILCVWISLLTFVPAVFAASDVRGHWAEDVINNWLDQELVQGYEDGAFRPDVPISRAEFMTMVNQTFSYEKDGNPGFVDVDPKDWYYPVVVRATEYIKGYPDKTIRPNQPITRQEVASILASIGHLRWSDEPGVSFTDDANLANWSRSAVFSVCAQGYMQGYPDGSFKPTYKMTRAEALQALDNTKSRVHVLHKPGEYSSLNFEGSLVVAHPSISLRDVRIKGDLIVGEEVGEGDVHLHDLRVEGDMFVRGGGLDSVYIDGGSYKNVVVEKSGSGVRLVCTNHQGVEIILDTDDGKVVLEGAFAGVRVSAEGIDLSFKGDTTVATLNIEDSAGGIQVKTSDKVVIKQAKIEAKVDFRGQGKIEKAEGKGAQQSSYDKLPDSVNGLLTKPSTSSSSHKRNSSVASVQLDQEELRLAVGDVVMLTPSISPSSATNKRVFWTSSDANVASIDDLGQVKALGPGEAIIQVTTASGGYQATTKVVVRDFIFDKARGAITEYVGNQKDLVIPSTIEGVGVQEIGDGAFLGKDLTSAVIPSSVTKMGKGAFNQNKFTDEKAFIFARKPDGSIDATSLVSYAGGKKAQVMVPDTVVTIGDSAFWGSDLVSLTLPSSLQEIEDYAFSMNKLTEIVIPDSVRTIKDHAFHENHLQSVHLGSSVVTIEDHAFSNNQLESVTVPRSVTSIGEWAFYTNKLTEVSISNAALDIKDHAFYFNEINRLTLGNAVKSLGEGAFAQNRLTYVAIPESALEIKERVFSNNGPDKKSANLPGADYVGTWRIIKDRWVKEASAADFVFDSETNTITSYKGSSSEVVIPNYIAGHEVEKIGAAAFKEKNLSQVVFPQTLTSIGSEAFYHNKLSSVILPGAVVELASDAFANNGPNHASKSILTTDNTGLWRLVDNDWVLAPAEYEFDFVTGTITGFTGDKTDVNIPSKICGVPVSGIGELVFAHKGLTSVDIPRSVTRIGAAAFNNNKFTDEKAFIFARNDDGSEDKTTLISYGGLRKIDVVLPSTVETIGKHAFSFTSLESVSLGESVATIEEYAFFYNQLKSIRLPGSVKVIGQGAFSANGSAQDSLPNDDARGYAGLWIVQEGVWVKVD